MIKGGNMDEKRVNDYMEWSKKVGKVLNGLLEEIQSERKLIKEDRAYKLGDILTISDKDFIIGSAGFKTIILICVKGSPGASWGEINEVENQVKITHAELEKIVGDEPFTLKESL